ncbi:hypothetical protein K4K59_006713 [Colletotrichum sp. SAR11_240]|nr:hypothetical protein K4K59_006713 [Colletotrichum sp. SAR11_240]
MPEIYENETIAVHPNGKPVADPAADIQASMIFNFSVIYRDPPGRPLAADVILHWCVKTYDANVTNNVLYMDEVSSLTMVNTSHLKEAEMQLGNFFLFNQSTYSFYEPTKFTVGGRETKAIRKALEYALVRYNGVDGYSFFETGADRLRYAMDEIKLHLLPQKPNVYGTAWVKQIDIEIRWEWLIFLAAQIVISIIILGLVIWETYEVNIDIIKSATIPALFAINSQEMARLELRSRGRRTTLLEQYQFIDMLETPFGKSQEPHVSSAHPLPATWQNIALHKSATL